MLDKPTKLLGLVPPRRDQRASPPGGTDERSRDRWSSMPRASDLKAVEASYEASEAPSVSWTVLVYVGPVDTEVRLVAVSQGVRFNRQTWRYPTGKLTASIHDEIMAVIQDFIGQALASLSGIALSLFTPTTDREE